MGKKINYGTYAWDKQMEEHRVFSIFKNSKQINNI